VTESNDITITSQAEQERTLSKLRQARLADSAVAEQTMALAAPLDRNQGSTIPLLCFRVAGERFALPAASVERVFLVAAVRRIPHRKRAAFRGMVAHEGEILLLGSFERLLDLPTTVTANAHEARMVLLGPAGRGWVFEANSVDGVMQVKKSDLRPAPGTVSRGMGSATRFLVSLRDGDASLLDPETLITGWEAAAQ